MTDLSSILERSVRGAAIAAALALVSACSPATPPDNASTPEDMLCGANKLDRFVNMLPTSDAKAQIAAIVGPRRTRYIGPDDAVTMDFNPERLNADLGEDGRIKRFHCG